MLWPSLVMAAAMVIGSISEDHFLVVGLTAFGTVIKGWNDFKKFLIQEWTCVDLPTRPTKRH